MNAQTEIKVESNITTVPSTYKATITSQGPIAADAFKTMFQLEYDPYAIGNNFVTHNHQHECQ